MDRTILHCDMNSFFASVELLDHPELAERPVAVAGDPSSRHGIILAKNEAAKKFGIKTAETIWQAKRKCPELILLRSHHDKYEEYCRKINSIYLRYTDLVEPFSIDESWLDVTASLPHFRMSGKEIADDIRITVKKELGLTLSAGVSFNKIFAKMGSDYKKPYATTVISRDNYKQLLWPLPAGDLIFVGKQTVKRLEDMNIRTIGDIAMADRDFLISAFGKHGEMMSRYARGEDDEPVAPYTAEREYKSVGNSITFKRNLQGRDDVKTAVKALSDKVSARLRGHELKCCGVKVDIKDPGFRTITRQLQLDFATNSTEDIAQAAMELMDRSWRYENPIRLLSVTAINIAEGETEEQLSLFSQPETVRKNNEAVDSAMDSIRAKFGKYSIIYGGSLDNDLGISYKNTSGEQNEEIEID